MIPVSVQVHADHYRRFEKEFMERPDVTPHVEEGKPVCEYFFDKQGNHQYCFDPPREAFDEWIKDNPDPDRQTELQGTFVKHLAALTKSRMNYRFYGNPEGPPVAANRMLEAEAMYMNIAKDVAGVFFSMTDSREDNKAIYRLTAQDGTVIPFDRPGFEDDFQALGIIRQFHEAVNT